MTRLTDHISPVSVLIVDDNRDITDSLAAALAANGYSPRVAYNGAAALQMSAADPPDVVFLDVVMPGMDGWELARRLRDLVPGRRPLLVAVTGQGTAADRA